MTSRWGRRSTLSVPSSLRLGVCPPSLRQAPSSPWQRLLFWFIAPAPQDVAPPIHQLPAVRKDFAVVLADIETAEASRLRARIEHCVTLRELWHLRAEVYRVVGVAHSQSEAEQRLVLLNRHFPARAPRSQFAPL